jgi:hypothetical protein
VARAEQLVQELLGCPEVSARPFLDHRLEAVLQAPHVGGEPGVKSCSRMVTAETIT